MERFSENELDEGLDLSRIESGIERAEIATECAGLRKECATLSERITQLAQSLENVGAVVVEEIGKSAENDGIAAAGIIGKAAKDAAESLAAGQREATEAITAQLKSHREFIMQQRRDDGGISVPAVFFYVMVSSLIFLAAFFAVVMFANMEIFHIAKLETLTWAFLAIIIIFNGAIIWLCRRFGWE